MSFNLESERMLLISYEHVFEIIARCSNVFENGFSSVIFKSMKIVVPGFLFCVCLSTLIGGETHCDSNYQKMGVYQTVEHS